jgi:DNA-directed RNA polymerase subunit K/omega
MPKPTTTATEEFLEGKLNYRMRDQVAEEDKAD